MTMDLTSWQVIALVALVGLTMLVPYRMKYGWRRER